jgi:hypothetical protein
VRGVAPRKKAVARATGKGAESDAPYTLASRLRLAVSMEASELADSARGWVHIVDGTVRRTGSGGARGQVIEDVRRLVSQAEHVLEWVVIYELEGGTSWEDIADTLGITEEQAKERYGEADRRFRESLAEPEATAGDGRQYIRLHPAVHEPEVWAPRLDEVVIRHREPTDYDKDDPAPVSGHLVRMDPLTELSALSGQRHDLFIKHRVPPASALLPLAEREAVLWGRIVQESTGRGRADAKRWAAEAAAGIDRLREQAAAEAAAEGEVQ